MDPFFVKQPGTGKNKLCLTGCFPAGKCDTAITFFIKDAVPQKPFSQGIRRHPFPYPLLSVSEDHGDGLRFQEFRIGTPSAAQGTAHEKHRCPDSRSVLRGIALNVSHQSAPHRSAGRFHFRQFSVRSMMASCVSGISETNWAQYPATRTIRFRYRSGSSMACRKVAESTTLNWLW